MGSLISVQHVITAAHCIWHNKATFTGGCRPGCELAGDCNSGCVRRNPEDVYLYLGITDRFKPEEGFMRNVVKIILHPGYDKGADSEDQTLNGHDIAILTMSTSMEMFEIGKRSIPICLPESTHAYLTDEKEDLRVTGFGLFDQRHHRILQTASITIEDRRQCVAVWNKSNFSDICIKGDEGICPNQGDSGSGLVQQIYPRAGQFVLLALISFGDISCSRPSVATSIINHLDWIEKTISVNKKDKDGNNALHRAAKSGDLKKVEMLIEEYDADVNSQGQYDNTPLNWAAEKGHTQIVKLLLNTPGVDVNKKNTKGKTPLHNAAKYGHPDVVELLLDTPGVDVNAKDKSGETALLWAAFGGHTEIVELFLKTSVIEKNIFSEGGEILIAAAFKGHADIVKLLLKTPEVDVNARGVGGRTPLHYAAFYGHPEVAELLLATPSVDENAKTTKGETALLLAAFNGHTRIVELLLKAPGIDVNAENINRRTPLYMAANKGNDEIVRMLKAAGAI